MRICDFCVRLYATQWVEHAAGADYLARDSKSWNRILCVAVKSHSWWQQFNDFAEINWPNFVQYSIQLDVLGSRDNRLKQDSVALYSPAATANGWLCSFPCDILQRPPTSPSICDVIKVYPISSLSAISLRHINVIRDHYSTILKRTEKLPTDAM